MSTLREESREEWTGGSKVTDINAGSLQRIADATELMAKNYSTLVAERDKYERLYRAEQAGNVRLFRRITALKGHITKLRNQL